MSKKLVKTAKQQFEERLKELTLLTSCQEVNDENFYLCENGHKEMSILRDSKEHGFIEYKYQGSYQSMIDSEEFLYKMVCRFNEIGEPVKHIFDWYTSADKDLTPFTVYDIWQCMEYLTQSAFEDLYEEVPDVRIVTAKDQWEKDSKGAEVISTLANGSEYKVAVTDGSITFFVYQDGGEYFREVYPSFEELRKDVNFVMAYLSHVRATHDKDVDYALAWLQGGEYTMSKISLLDIYEVGKCIDHLCYEDKEEPVEAVKQDFSKDADELRKKMVAHLEELCENWMTVNPDYFMEEVGGESIVLKNDTCIPFCEIEYMWTGKDKESKWSLFVKTRTEEVVEMSELSIETLLRIIASMQ